ncbi:MAG TPA: DNA alkylation repair protein [Chitinophagaceae bacterium]
MSAQLKEIQKLLKQHADKNALVAQQRFVTGVEKVYGVYMPVLNNLAKQFKQADFDLVTELWNAGSLEERILAGKLLGRIAKRDPTNALQLVENFSGEITNWAVCDALGMQALKPVVKTHQKEIFVLAKKLNKSQNQWQRRLSLVLVEWYTRNEPDHNEIKELVNNLKNDKEYYVKKAVVWIERNFKKGR